MCACSWSNIHRIETYTCLMNEIDYICSVVWDVKWYLPLVFTSSCLLHELLLNMLLLHHYVHICRVLLLSFLELNGVSWSEIHKRYIDTLRHTLRLIIHGSSTSGRHWCHVGWNVVVMCLVREICSRCSSVVESTSIISGNHMWQRVILVRHIDNALPWIWVRLKVSTCQHCRQLVWILRSCCHHLTLLPILLLDSFPLRHKHGLIRHYAIGSIKFHFGSNVLLSRSEIMMRRRWLILSFVWNDISSSSPGIIRAVSISPCLVATTNRCVPWYDGHGSINATSHGVRDLLLLLLLSNELVNLCKLHALSLSTNCCLGFLRSEPKSSLVCNRRICGF